MLHVKDNFCLGLPDFEQNRFCSCVLLERENICVGIQIHCTGRLHKLVQRLCLLCLCLVPPLTPKHLAKHFSSLWKTLTNNCPAIPRFSHIYRNSDTVLTATHQLLLYAIKINNTP